MEMNCRELAAIGVLLEYPEEDYRQRLSHVAALLHESGSAAAAFVDEFATEVLDWTPTAFEERYTGTFDVSPAAIPYASVHLFGTESFHRGELMARLRQAFADAGFETGNELPDHVGLLMRALPLLDPEKRSEIVTYCLPRPLKKIHEELTRSVNPYRHIVAAAISLVGEAQPLVEGVEEVTD